MSGETKSHESGWTVDTLKELQDERERHRNEIREADKQLQVAYKESTDIHLLQLNENAKRTIEERGHFLSVEAYEPFRDAVAKFMATSAGNFQGSQITMGKIYAAIGAVGVIISIIVLLSNHVLH